MANNIVKNIFITGGNRGIGLSLIKEMIPRLKPNKLFATFRNVAQAKELHELAKAHPCLQLIQLDIRDDHKFENIAAQVDKETNGGGLNFLINNAGITSKYAKLNVTKKEQLIENFEINTVAPILLTKAMLPLLEKASGVDPNAPLGVSRAAVVNISSILGSISSNDNGGMYAYRCSKSAINAATKSMSFDFKRSKILSVAVHPGWVQTEMGGPKAPLTPSQSATHLVALFTNLNQTHNGNLLNYDGKTINW